jgi:hypothetical protein
MSTVIDSRKLLARIGSATLSAALAGVILGFFGSGPLAWGSPFLWLFVAVVFLLALRRKQGVSS